jgi:HEAT repeat protein
MPCLINGLTNQSPDVRRTAADYLLGELGSQFPGQQKEAVPLVQKLLNDPDENVRNSVTSGLKAISTASH